MHVAIERPAGAVAEAMGAALEIDSMKKDVQRCGQVGLVVNAIADCVDDDKHVQ